MALTELGFKRRTYDEILSGKIEKAKELFGEDIDTSELTPLGKYIRINAYDQALTEEEAEMVYYSIFPNTATGTSLDRLCVFVGITRNPATYAQYMVTITGTAGGVIPSGFLVGTESGINFLTLEEYAIPESGTIDVLVESYEVGGTGNVLAQEINTIVNPTANVESVIGKKVVSKGEDVESDFALRQRFTAAGEGMGSCNETAITAALLRIAGVTHAGIIVNETDETVDGRPPRSFECFVECGSDDEMHEQIAKAIFEKKPIGIKTHGTVAQEILDSGGYSHTINFSHTTTVSVYVKMAIKTSAKFEGDTGKQAIKSNLETYIDNVGIGNPVVFSSLYGQIHSVTGVQEVTELLLSTDGETWTTDNITTEKYENCMFVQLEIKQNDNADYEVVS